MHIFQISTNIDVIFSKDETRAYMKRETRYTFYHSQVQVINSECSKLAKILISDDDQFEGKVFI